MRLESSGTWETVGLTARASDRMRTRSTDPTPSQARVWPSCGGLTAWFSGVSMVWRLSPHPVCSRHTKKQSTGGPSGSATIAEAFVAAQHRIESSRRLGLDDPHTLSLAAGWPNPS
jgi:hypothetical protein